MLEYAWRSFGDHFWMLWESLGDQNAISWPAGAREAGGRKKMIFCERARNSCGHPPFRCRVVNLERSNTLKHIQNDR